MAGSREMIGGQLDSNPGSRLNHYLIVPTTQPLLLKDYLSEMTLVSHNYRRDVVLGSVYWANYGGF